MKEDTPKSKVLHNVGTMLTLGFEAMLDEEPLEFREKLKQEFYKWLNTSQIKVENAPSELKCALVDFHEILECCFEKARKDRSSRKREIEIGSPEYLKKMQEVFQIFKNFRKQSKAEKLTKWMTESLKAIPKKERKLLMLLLTLFLRKKKKISTFDRANVSRGKFPARSSE